MSHLHDLIAHHCPDGVPFKALGEIGQFSRGRRFTKRDYVENGVPVIHYGDIYTHFGPSTRQVVAHVRADLGPKLRFAIPGDVVLTDVGETVEDVGKAVAWLGEGPVAIHDHCYGFRSEQDPAFIAYVMQSDAYQKQKNRHVARTKVKTLLMDGVARVRIPVPPLPVQREVVRILDRLVQLESELEAQLRAELEARRVQLQYYRDQLLSFDEASDD